MMQKRLLVAALLAAMSVGLAACGGSDDDSEPTPTPAPSPTPTPDPTPTPTPDPTPDPTPEPTPNPDPSPDPKPDPEPTPDPDPVPEPGGGAGDCFNPAEFTVGSSWKMEYKISGLYSGTSSSAGEVLRRTDFAGYSALETALETVTAYAGLPAVTTESVHYSDMIGGNLLESYGSKLEADVMGMTQTSISTYEPPYRNVMWTLAAGQTESYSYTIRTEATMTGSPVPVPPTVTEHTASGTWTYHGRENVTVPLGTFNACKFTQTEEGSTNVVWYASSGGVMLKSQSVNDGAPALVAELTKGQFNGADIKP